MTGSGESVPATERRRPLREIGCQVCGAWWNEGDEKPCACEVREAPDGYEWAWTIDRKWSAWPRSAGRCRFAVGPDRKACGAPAVASMNRQRQRWGKPPVDLWWDYCGDHLYGRRHAVIDGLPVVFVQVLREIGSGVPDDFGPTSPIRQEYERLRGEATDDR